MAFDFFKSKRNIISLITSVVLAVIFWYYAKTNEVVVIDNSLMLEVKVPKNIILKEISTDSVKLRVEAKKRQQNILKKVSPVLTLTYDFPGIYKFKLDEKDLSFPILLGIEDYEILMPDSIQVVLDSLVRTEVSITSVKGMVFEPGKVILSGPKSVVSNIEYLSPDSIPGGIFTTVTISDPLVEVFPSKIKVIK
jgi:hypothetical protein